MEMLFGTFVQTIVLVVITYKTDWDEQVLALFTLFTNVMALFFDITCTSAGKCSS